MKEVYVLVGLPGSGKSTYARKLVEQKPESIIISPDYLRIMLHDVYVFNDKYERIIRQMVSKIFEIAILSPDVSCVIFDECLVSNTIEQREILIRYIRSFEPQIGHRIIIKAIIFETTVEDCIKRRHKDPKGSCPKSWDKVIKGRAAEHEDLWDEDFDFIQSA
jgi:predicted kinase